MPKIKYFLIATRPKTLPAGIIPVCIGSAAAFTDGHFQWFYSFVALICSILIQIITNYVNEIYDHKRGADSPARLGPRRAVASGLITSAEMKIMTIVLAIITFLLGLILVSEAGWPIFIVGVLSLLFAWAYTGGPFPLAYKGIADIFVLIFFGIIAVCGTYYIQMKTINIEIFITSFAPGFLSMNILGINNIRDIETDRKVDKNTLALILGRDKAVLLFNILNIFTFLIPVILYFISSNIFILLPILTAPLAFLLARNLKKMHGSKLNSVLAKAGLLLLLYGICMIVGILS